MASIKRPPGCLHVKNIRLASVLWDEEKVPCIFHVSQVVFVPRIVMAAKKSENQEKIHKASATTPRSWKREQANKSSDFIEFKRNQGSEKEMDTKVQSQKNKQMQKPIAAYSLDVSGEEVTQLVVPLKRNTILRACILTSGGLATAGISIRWGSHWLYQIGWLSTDCTRLMPYNFELWHLGTTAVAVMLVTALRHVLLKKWPAFSRSSQGANEQVLRSLEPLDYVIVSFLPGISEELLFRGAVLPVFGLDWKGPFLAGIIFGALHLTGGRNKAFAIWASFIGVLYGILAVVTMDLLVPMSTHSLANLVAAVMWKQSENSNSSVQE